MVVFTCQNCGEPVNKPKVEKHYQTKCRGKSWNLTCVDCLKDFLGDEYDAHTQCVSEQQRYSAKGTVFKEAAGRNRQQRYVEMIQNLLNSKKDLTDNQRAILDLCSNFNNVPRKLPKFLNFMRNVGQRKYNEEDLTSVFQILEDAWKKEVESANQNNKTPSKEKECTAEEMKENRGENGHSIAESSDANIAKKKKDKKTRDTSVVEEENAVENGHAEESKENEGLSKKELKKLKKQKKYQLELENVAKMENSNENGEVFENTNDNVKKKSKKMKANYENDGNNDAVSEEVINKKNKKHKKNKHENGLCETVPENSETVGNEGTENMDVEESTVVAGEAKSKKHKKRKLDDSTMETTGKKAKTMQTEEEESAGQATFDWTDVILRVLESRPDKELSLKRLGKKVIDEYQTVKADHRTYEELLAKFNKKVQKTRGVRVLKDKAKLIQ